MLTVYFGVGATESLIILNVERLKIVNKDSIFQFFNPIFMNIRRLIRYSFSPLIKYNHAGTGSIYKIWVFCPGKRSKIPDSISRLKTN